MVGAAVLFCSFALVCGGAPWGPPSDYGGKFKPGWNGLAMKPPMGWRSWNAFGNRITQDMMMVAANAIVSKTRTINGKSGISLCDMGYCSVGVDEGWEDCNGPNVAPGMSQHDAKGFPTIDATFPDSGKMVQQIQALGLDAGWYLNGCKCGEKVAKDIDYEGDVTLLHKFGFDGVKIDGCGAQRNQTLYAALMKQSKKNYTIENCHWGDCTNSDDSSCPSTEWCPWNMYRSSGDINSAPESWFENLQKTKRFLDIEAPLSVPGCWAYPDMLEVGRVTNPDTKFPPRNTTTATWNRAHFGAWCIVSSPLILGLELTNDKLNPILDIIGNAEAVAVNQNWAGHPGFLFDEYDVVPPAPAPHSGCFIDSDHGGISYVGGNIFGDHHIVNTSTTADECCKMCSQYKTATPHTTACVFWQWDSQSCYGHPGPCCRLKSSVAWAGRNQQGPRTAVTGSILPLPTTPTPAPNPWGQLQKVQIWAKPQPGKGFAVMLINASPETTKPYTLSFDKLNMTASSVTVRDIWNRKDLGKSTSTFTVPAMSAFDSGFYLLQPV